MVKNKIPAEIIRLALSAVTAAELTFLLDVGLALGRVRVAGKLLAVIALLLMAGVYFIGRRSKRRMLLTAVIPAALVVLLFAVYGGWSVFSANAGYADPDTGKTGFYADQRVMLIVPHQDDDLNLLEGVIEEYVAYGSDVYCVFVTNGDYAGLTQTRFAEAIAMFEHIGVAEDHVIFLGYGDQWREGHIYNAEPGVVMESAIGRTAVYGTESHPAYHEGAAYTIDNLVGDMRSVILEYRPDVIFCTDYDAHADHQATSLVFDRVMGLILKSETEYCPTVFKGYAYNTAWLAEMDFYTENILSTQNVFTEVNNQKPEGYRWEDRVRLPVDAATLSRSLLGSGSYETLAIYESQGANQCAGSVVNGDKVFWKRETTSVIYAAQIGVSSGDAALLNDFMLTDNRDLLDGERLPWDGTWIPDPEDTERTVTVTLAEKSDLYSIVLYDHPSPEHNVLDAEIIFDDGTIVHTGMLDARGAGTVIVVERENVGSFQIRINESKGRDAGLTEMEAYREEPAESLGFVKLMDTGGNFVYDYYLPEEGSGVFSLYTYGAAPEEGTDHYTVSGSNSSCTAALTDDGRVEVFCPRGETCVVTLTSTDGMYSDSILVRNPGNFSRWSTRLWQNLEKTVYSRIVDQTVDNMLTVKLFEKISDILGS